MLILRYTDPGPSYCITTDGSKDQKHVIADSSKDQKHETADSSKDQDHMTADRSKDQDYVKTGDSNDQDCLTTDSSENQDSKNRPFHKEVFALCELTKNKFTCNSCYKGFPTEVKLRAHMKHSHKQDLPEHGARLKYICLICSIGFRYATKCGLMKHHKKHHQHTKPKYRCERIIQCSNPEQLGSLDQLHNTEQLRNTGQLRNSDQLRSLHNKLCAHKVKIGYQLTPLLKKRSHDILKKYRIIYGHKGQHKTRKENWEKRCIHNVYLWLFRCYACNKHIIHRRNIPGHMKIHEKQET